MPPSAPLLSAESKRGSIMTTSEQEPKAVVLKMRTAKEMSLLPASAAIHVCACILKSRAVCTPLGIGGPSGSSHIHVYITSTSAFLLVASRLCIMRSKWSALITASNQKAWLSPRPAFAGVLQFEEKPSVKCMATRLKRIFKA
eukprot:1153319-Pelagomonas_calceolata.AAC.3